MVCRTRSQGLRPSSLYITAIGTGNPATGDRVRKIEPLLSGSSRSPAVTT